MREFVQVCAEGCLEDDVSMRPGPSSDSGSSDGSSDGNFQGRNSDETRGNWDLLHSEPPPPL